VLGHASQSKLIAGSEEVTAGGIRRWLAHHANGEVADLAELEAVGEPAGVVVPVVVMCTFFDASR
jgi:hypothetical protein